MIKNERQYNITRARIRRLEAVLDELLTDRDSPADNARHELEVRAVRAAIEELADKVGEYESLRSGDVVVRAETLAELPHALIRARIAAGLTQNDLARRLRIKEQQIQRYEATDYESASLERLLKVAHAVGLEPLFTAPPLPNWTAVLRRVGALGLDKTFVQSRIAPHSHSDELRAVETVSRIAHIYGVPAEDVLSGNAALDESQFAAAAYKVPQHARRAAVIALSGYAQFLTRLVAEAAPEPIGALPRTSTELRALILSEAAKVTFGGALRTLWDCGVAILPMAERGGFHAGYWRHGETVVVVLNSMQRYESTWLFDLLHEIGHVVNDTGDSMVEMDVGAEVSDARSEQLANDFASEVILGGGAGAVFDTVVERAKGRPGSLQRAVAMVARQEGYDVGAVAMNVAYRMQRRGINWWGAAHALAAQGEDPWQVARNEALVRLNWGPLSPLDAQLLSAALGDVSDPDVEGAP